MRVMRVLHLAALCLAALFFFYKMYTTDGDVSQSYFFYSMMCGSVGLILIELYESKDGG